MDTAVTKNTSDRVWENQIAINVHDTSELTAIEAAAHYRDPKERSEGKVVDRIDIDRAVERDGYALPPAGKIREGYYRENHYRYWLSGLIDYLNLTDIAIKFDVSIDRYLDLGCSSGRVLRHFSVQPDRRIDVYGADLNLTVIRWCQRFLAPDVIAFQNSSVPHLPIADDSFSLISAFSVFTHIEAFDLAWLMELRRVLKPGGIAYITAKTDYTLKHMTPKLLIYKGVRNHPDWSDDLMGADMKTDRLIFRWRSGTSYSSQVFLHTDYINNVWGRVLAVKEVRRRFPNQQDAIILQKT